MPTQVNPQEIYQLECYISLAYFGELRDTWAEMVKHVEACLESFTQGLPDDYRARSLPEQPDIVWGECVLPNFRRTLQNLNTGFILLSHGDVKGLDYAHSPINDFKGQKEYWSGWMSHSDEELYESLLNKATTMAGNICTTEGAYWKPRTLSNHSDQLGPLDPPDQWPAYRINGTVSVITGQKIVQSGIFVPDAEDSCAQFLSTEYEQAPPANVLVKMVDLWHPITGAKYGEQPVFEKRSCVWHLVERNADFAADMPLTTFAAPAHRVLAGGTCPETGFYLTPARPESRKLFQKGEVMPSFDSSYGTTIWQWDSNQL